MEPDKKIANFLYGEINPWASEGVFPFHQMPSTVSEVVWKKTATVADVVVVVAWLDNLFVTPNSRMWHNLSRRLFFSPSLAGPIHYFLAGCQSPGESSFSQFAYLK